MKYCKTCHITYRTPLNNCMFCNNPLSTTDTGDCALHYPSVKKKSAKAKLLVRTANFLFLVANLFCLSIDFLFTNSRIHWSLLVLGASLFVILSSKTIHGNRTKTSQFVTVFLLLLAEILSIGFITKTPSWAVYYILPLGLLFLTFFMTCLLFGKVQRIYDYGIYMLSSSLLGLIPALILLCKKPDVRWPSVCCSLYSVVALLGLFFFTPRAAKEELKRRFYL